MDLVRDVLDKRVVDRHGRDMGRVDSIVLDARDGTAPRVAAFDLGPAILASRVRPIFGRWVEALEHAFGVDAGRPVRIPFREVLGIADHVKVDVAFGDTAAATIELRLRRLVGAIPRSS